MSGFPIRREILVRFPAAGWGGRERSYYLLGSVLCTRNFTVLSRPGHLAPRPVVFVLKAGGRGYKDIRDLVRVTQLMCGVGQDLNQLLSDFSPGAFQ